MNLFKVGLWGSIILILAMLWASFLPSPADSREQGAGRVASEQARRGHRQFGPEAPWISIMLRYRSELNLTEEQAKSLEKLRSEFQQQAGPTRAKLREAEKEIARLLQENALDMTQVKAKIEETERIRVEFRYLRIEVLEQGKSVLTAAQREQLKDLSASARGRFHRPQGQNS